MKTIRLVREVLAPDRTGPANGQVALQAALKSTGTAWLKVGGDLQADEIPWFWSWEDAEVACQRAAAGRPFILGPNVLFADSRQPLKHFHERILVNAASCKLMITESRWYAELIRAQVGACQAPIAIVPYPIDPLPGGPLTAKWDVLCYVKTGTSDVQITGLCQQCPNTVVVHRGNHTRDSLANIARRSRICFYLSDDDRGPLALAEILLCGCPAIGIAKGAPWIEDGVNGVLVESVFCGNSLTAQAVDAMRVCLQMKRGTVRSMAMARFEPAVVAAKVVALLKNIAAGA